jgi:hypothetical protein
VAQLRFSRAILAKDLGDGTDLNPSAKEAVEVGGARLDDRARVRKVGGRDKGRGGEV